MILTADIREPFDPLLRVPAVTVTEGTVSGTKVGVPYGAEADEAIEIGGRPRLNPHGGPLGEAYVHGMNGIADKKAATMCSSRLSQLDEAVGREPVQHPVQAADLQLDSLLRQVGHLAHDAVPVPRPYSLGFHELAA